MFATTVDNGEDDGLGENSEVWHDTYTQWSIIARYFHAEVLLEAGQKLQVKLTQGTVDLIDAAASNQLKRVSGFVFGFCLDHAFPRRLLTNVVMKRWMLHRGTLLGDRLFRILDHLDSDYKVDWYEVTEFVMIWKERFVSHMELRRFGEESRIEVPASMRIDTSWKTNLLHDDGKAYLESPDGFTKPTFRELFLKFATGNAEQMVKDHFKLFDQLAMKELAEDLAKKHAEMQKAVAYESTPDLLQTANKQQIAKAKAKRKPPTKDAAIALRVPVGES